MTTIFACMDDKPIDFTHIPDIASLEVLVKQNEYAFTLLWHEELKCAIDVEHRIHDRLDSKVRQCRALHTKCTTSSCPDCGQHIPLSVRKTSRFIKYVDPTTNRQRKVAMYTKQTMSWVFRFTHGMLLLKDAVARHERIRVDEMNSVGLYSKKDTMAAYPFGKTQFAWLKAIGCPFTFRLHGSTMTIDSLPSKFNRATLVGIDFERFDPSTIGLNMEKDDILRILHDETSRRFILENLRTKSTEAVNRAWMLAKLRTDALITCLALRVERSSNLSHDLSKMVAHALMG